MQNLELYTVVGVLILIGLFCLYLWDRQIKEQNIAKANEKFKEEAEAIKKLNLWVEKEEERLKELEVKRKGSIAAERETFRAQGYKLFREFYHKETKTVFRIVELELHSRYGRTKESSMKLRYVNKIGTIKHLTVRGFEAMDRYILGENQNVNENRSTVIHHTV